MMAGFGGDTASSSGTGLDASSTEPHFPGDSGPPAEETPRDAAAEDSASLSASAPRAAVPRLDPATRPVSVALPAAAAASSARAVGGETAAVPDVASHPGCGGGASRPGAVTDGAVEDVERPADGDLSRARDGGTRGSVERDTVATPTCGAPLRRSVRDRRKPDFFQSDPF